MEVTCPDPPLPQDVPPPRDSSSSQDKKASSTAKFKVKHAAKNWQLSVPLQELLSSSELEATVHDVFTEDGRERVCASHFTMQYRCMYLQLFENKHVLLHAQFPQSLCVDYYKCTSF